MARRPVEGDPEVRADQRQSAFIEGYSLHAGTHVAADNRLGLERLARYAGRPPLSLSRLRLRPDGKVTYSPGGHAARARALSSLRLSHSWGAWQR